MRLTNHRIRAPFAVLGGLALLAFSFVLHPWGRQDPGKRGPAFEERGDVVLYPVQIAVARTGELVKRLSTSGILRANREVEIRSRIAGSLIAISAYDGKFVRSAERLAAIDDREYRVA
ncbi:MAG TPA: hypothetical protein VLT13_10805, partial [Bacteroidota bacterium]|nr:hypothetical protein [Bacteroidota bacterium]